MVQKEFTKFSFEGADLVWPSSGNDVGFDCREKGAPEADFQAWCIIGEAGLEPAVLRSLNPRGSVYVASERTAHCARWRRYLSAAARPVEGDIRCTNQIT